MGTPATARPTPLRRRHQVEDIVARAPDGGFERQLLIDGEGLMGAAELADALGIRVQNIRFVRDLPEAVAHLRSSRIWLAREVNDFAEQQRLRKAR